MRSPWASPVEGLWDVRVIGMCPRDGRDSQYTKTGNEHGGNGPSKHGYLPWIMIHASLGSPQVSGGPITVRRGRGKGPDSLVDLLTFLGSGVMLLGRVEAGRVLLG